MAEGQLRPDLMRPQPFPLVVDGVRACFGAGYEMVPRRNAALQQTSDLPLIAIDDANVITFVKPSNDRTNRVTVGFALSRDVHELQLPPGETVVVVNGERRHSAPGEILVAGAQSGLDRGGTELRIEPDRDAALFFRCLA
jgi:starch synthase (maltosyl-transferring)